MSFVWIGINSPLSFVKCYELLVYILLQDLESVFSGVLGRLVNVARIDEFRMNSSEEIN